MNTVCIFSHDCRKFSTAQISVQLTDMANDHKTRRSPAIQHACIGLHVVQRSAVSADIAIRLIVETPPGSVRIKKFTLF